MKINTKYFGELDVAEEEALCFPEPLPGFDGSREYVIIRFDDEDDSLYCLQSMTDPTLALVIINPFYLVPDYAPWLNAEDFKTLKAQQDTPLAFYAIAVVHDDWMDSTINLRCPIAINPENRLGKQIVMDDLTYSMRHPINVGTEKEG